MGIARGVLVCFAGAALTACQYAQGVNRQGYETYHDSRWRAAAVACAQEREYAEPHTPVTPRLAANLGLDHMYRQIPELRAEERRQFVALTARSEVSAEFVAEMLSVLSNRDTMNIESLADQIDEYFARQEAALANWRAARAAFSGNLEAIAAGWDEIWPANEFSFDFDAALAEQRRTLVPELTEVRTTALKRYYDNEYNRQAMIYLDYTPVEFEVLPKSHVPQGCAALSAALNRQEAGLLARYSLDQALSTDVELVQRLALVDMSQTRWEDVKVPKGRYAEPRVAAAIARLKLLKYLDELLSGSLDVFLYDVDTEWATVWPGHELETNIFSFAGLPRNDGLTPAANAQ